MQSQSTDEIFSALADERRRLVIQYLMNDPDGAASYREVAEYISAQTRNSPTEVMIHLRHAVFPMLAERDLIEYEPEEGVVHYQPNTVLEGVLNSVDEA